MKTLTSIIILAFTFSCSDLLSAQTVNIPDPELQAAVRKALGKPDGEITVTDMESLTELDASHLMRDHSNGEPPNIKSIQGLESAKNLASLDLSGAETFAQLFPNIEIEDFSALKDLERLLNLNLANNALPGRPDLSFLTNLTNLQALNLYTLYGNLNNLSFRKQSNETDLSFLGNLVNLRDLDLGFNNFRSETDVSFLSKLTKLEILNMEANQLEGRADFAFLEGLANLQTLDLNRNGLTSVTLPEGLVNLQKLDLDRSRNTNRRLAVPIDFDLDRLDLDGFSNQ